MWKTQKRVVFCFNCFNCRFYLLTRLQNVSFKVKITKYLLTLAALITQYFLNMYMDYVAENKVIYIIMKTSFLVKLTELPNKAA